MMDKKEFIVNTVFNFSMNNYWIEQLLRCVEIFNQLTKNFTEWFICLNLFEKKSQRVSLSEKIGFDSIVDLMK